MAVFSIIYKVLTFEHTHQTAEGDRWRQAGKVDEKERCNALRVQSVFEVTQVMRISALSVIDQTTKQAFGALQWVAIRISFLQCYCKITRKYNNKVSNYIR